jgi:hypothetical protein
VLLEIAFCKGLFFLKASFIFLDLLERRCNAGIALRLSSVTADVNSSFKDSNSFFISFNSFYVNLPEILPAS